MFTAVSDRSQVAEARRRISDEAAKIGVPRDRIDQTDIVVTELATNLLKHGGGGFIHARPYDDAGGSGLEMLAMDRGKGMADVGRCMEDGYSTAGSPGTGLGAIKRLTDDMRTYSRAGLGTAIMARMPTTPRQRTRHVGGSRPGAISRRAGLWRQLVVQPAPGRTDVAAG